MKNNLFRLVILVFLNVLVCNALATDYVSSVRSYQDGKNIVITYELSKQADISVSVSTDGGKTYKTLSSVYGDVGNMIKPGSKKIVWDVLNEYESFYFSKVCFKVDTNSYNGHEFVDLGLPSGTLWATCNVGASKPEEYGDYFAWGETKTKSNYSWSIYKWCNGSHNTLTKYCTDSRYGKVDNKKNLTSIDDTAYANWGGDWRMPTETDFDELHKKCTWKWTSQNAVKGYRVVSNINGNSIFLPAAGYRGNSNFYFVGSDGNYSSSSLGPYYTSDAYYLHFDPTSISLGCTGRNYGQSVRPVLSK